MQHTAVFQVGQQRSLLVLEHEHCVAAHRAAEDLMHRGQLTFNDGTQTGAQLGDRAHPETRQVDDHAPVREFGQ